MLNIICKTKILIGLVYVQFSPTSQLNVDLNLHGITHPFLFVSGLFYICSLAIFNLRHKKDCINL